MVISMLALSFFLPEGEITDEKDTLEMTSTDNGESPIDLFSAEFKEGKKIFYSNCASCHNRNMVDDMTGPALAGVIEKWSDYPRSDLYDWIRNSQKMIQEDHPRAQEIWRDWKPVVMNNFANLTDEKIESVLVYIEKVGE